MGDERHERDMAPPLRDSNTGPREEPKLPPHGGPIFDTKGKLRGGALQTEYGEFKRLPETTTKSASHDGGAAEANRAALEFLRQALDNLATAYQSDYTTGQIAVRIMSVYTMGNNLVRGSNDWDHGIQAEFEAWLPYELESSARKEYYDALSAVHFAGEALYTAATAWQAANPNGRIPSAIPSLAAHLHGTGVQWRGAIDTAHGKIAWSNHEALALVRQAMDDLNGASDAETIVRNAGTALSMINRLLHPDSDGDPALDDEYRAWVSLSPTDAAITAKAAFASAIQTFYDRAGQWGTWYPNHSFHGWTDSPLHDLLQAASSARTTIATP